jgi:hypothetical protein
MHVVKSLQRFALQLSGHKQFLAEGYKVKDELHQFVSVQEKRTVFISLGQNCSTSWYLKQANLKRESYPFDWIFSSPEIILDCMQDRFQKFLDKSLIVEHEEKQTAGHSVYHQNLFNHRNPLLSEEDYAYYQRCCSRFLQEMESNRPKVYVMTLINEPDKRKLWAQGFNQRFMMPTNQDETSVENVIQYLHQYDAEAKFIIVDHYTEGERTVWSRQVSEHVMFVLFKAGGSNNGVRYLDKVDDKCFKLILSGLGRVA